MASSASKSVSTKKLKEHLQEAQEPFSLGIYLSEREYMMNCLSFTSKTSCCLMSSLTNLKRPCNNGINKKKIADAIRYLKLILYRISSPGDAQELSNSSSSSGDELVSEKTQQRQQIPKTDCIDLLTSPCPLFEYSFEEDSLLSKHRDGSLLTKVTQAFNLGNLKQKEIVKERNPQWVCKRNKKLYSPASVLQVVSSNQETKHKKSPSTSQTLLTRDANCNLMIAPFIWESIMNSMIQRQNQIVSAEVKKTLEPNGFIFQRTKWVMHRSKELLFNRLKMVMRPHGRKKNTQKNIRDFLGPEYLENIATEQLISGKKRSQNDAKVYQMSLESYGISEDWNNSKLQRKKVGKEIADGITDEVVTELVNLLLQ